EVGLHSIATIGRDGRIEPGSGGAVFTGQSLFLRPPLTAITSAMLSFLLRPLTGGTVIGGSLAAVESLAPLAAPVLDAARPGLVVVADRGGGVPAAGSEGLRHRPPRR